MKTIMSFYVNLVIEESVMILHYASLSPVLANRSECAFVMVNEWLEQEPLFPLYYTKMSVIYGQKQGFVNLKAQIHLGH